MIPFIGGTQKNPTDGEKKQGGDCQRQTRVGGHIIPSFQGGRSSKDR